MMAEAILWWAASVGYIVVGLLMAGMLWAARPADEDESIVKVVTYFAVMGWPLVLLLGVGLGIFGAGGWLYRRFR